MTAGLTAVGWAAILQAGAAVVLVFVTAAYVWLTRKSLIEIENARASEIAPYVIVYFDTPEDLWIELVIKNVGKTPAIDFKINVEPMTDLFEHVGILHNGSPSIPPGYEIRSFVSMARYLTMEGVTLTFTATITYRAESETAKPIVSKQVLDLSVHKDRSSIDRKNIHHVAENLGKICKQLEILAKQKQK